MVRPPAGGTGLSFQLETDYARPVWPTAPGAQQMMSHLDIGVADLDAGWPGPSKWAPRWPIFSRSSTFG